MCKIWCMLMLSVILCDCDSLVGVLLIFSLCGRKSLLFFKDGGQSNTKVRERDKNKISLSVADTRGFSQSDYSFGAEPRPTWLIFHAVLSDSQFIT